MRLKGPFRKIFGMSKRDHGHHAGAGGVEYPVPFVHQNHCNLCGDASAQMLLMFNNRPDMPLVKGNVGHPNSFRLRRNPRGIVEGADDDDIGDSITAAGLMAWNIYPTAGQWCANSVRQALENYGPYAQQVQFSFAGHWVVVIGTDGQHVIYHDPWRGQNKRKTIADWREVAFPGQYAAVAATTNQPAITGALHANRK